MARGVFRLPFVLKSYNAEAAEGDAEVPEEEFPAKTQSREEEKREEVRNKVRRVIVFGWRPHSNG